MRRGDAASRRVNFPSLSPPLSSLSPPLSCSRRDSEAVERRGRAYPSIPKGADCLAADAPGRCGVPPRQLPEPFYPLPYTYDDRGNVISATVDGVFTNLYAYVL